MGIQPLKFDKVTPTKADAVRVKADKIDYPKISAEKVTPTKASADKIDYPKIDRV